MRPGEGLLRPQRLVTKKAVASALQTCRLTRMRQAQNIKPRARPPDPDLPHQHRMTAQPDDVITG